MAIDYSQGRYIVTDLNGRNVGRIDASPSKGLWCPHCKNGRKLF